MDISGVVNQFSSGNKDVIDKIDKFITVKCLKDNNKKKKKTYVIGLNDFMSDDEIKPFATFVQKKLGCGGGNIKVNEKDKKKIVIFFGDQINNIKQIILSKRITDEAHIK